MESRVLSLLWRHRPSKVLARARLTLTYMRCVKSKQTITILRLWLTMPKTKFWNIIIQNVISSSLKRLRNSDTCWLMP